MCNQATSSTRTIMNNKNKADDNIVCYYTNADQLLNKRSEFFTAMKIYNPDIIGVTEVKPKNGRYKVEESELAIDDYEMFHDLQHEGRGIILYVHNKLQPSLCTEITSDFSESVSVECKLKEGNKLLICLVYRRQDLPRDNDEKLNNLVENLAQVRATHKLIIGDFNYPELDWYTETSNAGPNHKATKFLKTTKDALFIQHQKKPTRYREGQQSNTLDLVFTDSEELIQEVKVEAPLGKSDHYSLLLSLSVSPSRIEKKPRKNFGKMDSKILKNELKQINWQENLESKDTNETWEFIKDKITEAIDKSTPMSKPTSKRGKQWMDKATLDIVKNKHKLFREWHKNGNDKNDKKDYNKANNRARKECRKANKAYERKIAEESKTNPKMFFKYTNSKLKSKSGIADLTKEDGTKTKDDSEKAELLNLFFQSVFTLEDDGPMPDFEGYDFESEINNIDIDKDMVKKLLSNLNVNKASGPDGIPPSVLSTAADELCLPITILFKKSLDSGTIPRDWKMAHVSPIYKKGNKAAVNNYRPVSLTCVLCKVLEKIVREKVINH